MNKIPYNMTSNTAYECPITGKTFGFVLRDKASQQVALAQQQLHTGAEIQRLERLAGRPLSYRELIRASRIEREQAAATESQPKEPMQENKEHPFVTQVFKSVTPCVG